jgi:hypothetical protein
MDGPECDVFLILRLWKSSFHRSIFFASLAFPALGKAFERSPLALDRGMESVQSWGRKSGKDQNEK